ncbi:aromatase/cyclase [Streptomyces sp. JJ66]|uniref:aromatase/cyclase n=1 Tax=Streptomyces sp. JJ66 TaxID=2803843 RepID=UPI001C575175|nr:aromatase/cyclase [Streptomyces sp. JJ66]MBW1602495.1 aromatase/cyclase [Streptomyces sp. JJ66]
MPSAATTTPATTESRTHDASRTPGPHTTRHTVTVWAPPRTVFGLLADVANWPHVFGPTVHSEMLQDDGRDQLLRLWAFAGGQVRTWTSRRELDPAAGRIVFRQTVPAAPVAAMGGEWLVEAHADGGSRVTLLHDFRAVDDDPAAVTLIGEAVERNSRAELAALKGVAEQGEQRAELVFTFRDCEHVHGAAEDVFSFLDRADLWPERLPHVARLALTEDEPGVQHLDMDTRSSADGSLHNTTSVRICRPEELTIVYKQLRVPAALAGHTGRWVIEQDSADSARLAVTSWHTVTLDPEGVRQALGPAATLAEARALVRKSLGANSSATLRYAKEYAESRPS